VLCLTVSDGVCKDQVIAAGKSTSPFTILTRADDTTYPLGRANALGACVDMNCAAECKP
jgi:hypothetical protein